MTADDTAAAAPPGATMGEGRLAEIKSMQHAGVVFFSDTYHAAIDDLLADNDQLRDALAAMTALAERLVKRGNDMAALLKRQCECSVSSGCHQAMLAALWEGNVSLVALAALSEPPAGEAGS